MKATGSPSELACRLDISERMAYNYLNLMKDMGAPIEYDSGRKSYFYTYETHFTYGFFVD